MKLVKTGLLAVLCLIMLSATIFTSQPSTYTRQTVARFTADAREFSTSLNTLKTAIAELKPGDKASRAAAIAALKASRLKYKKIEFFMEYFFEYPVNLYNRAPVYEVEEPYAEYQSPIGLQVMEGLLMEADPFTEQKELLDQCEVLAATASDIPAQLYGFTANDEQVLEAIRLELVRVMALGITGYDAPQLKTGIPEASVALKAAQDNLNLIFEDRPGVYTIRINQAFGQAITKLEAHPEFDGFDRLAFLREAALPLQEGVSQFITSQHLDLNTHTALNHRSRNLFTPDALDLAAFRDGRSNEAVVALGKALFFEKALSGNGRRNCATCHQPEKAFTDGLAKSRTLDEKGEVSRNAPTLYYAAYQRAQFYDGRAASLEAQIKAVLQNKHEMAANLADIAAWLNRDAHYKEAFTAAFHLPAGEPVTIEHAAGALAAYEQTLAPFSSPFDHYMAGDSLAMNAVQRRGFNLFMGKAQCGTCHFAPLFNGLLPPYYERTESEILGVPQSASLRHPVADTDSGRYNFFAISFNNGAFKTSTVRNSAATAPYMHNGVFKTLEQVIVFYDKGGGRGLKLNIEHQTLSDKPLKLAKAEKKALVAFLQALTDVPAKP